MLPARHRKLGLVAGMKQWNTDDVLSMDFWLSKRNSYGNKVGSLGRIKVAKCKPEDSVNHQNKLGLARWVICCNECKEHLTPPGVTAHNMDKQDWWDDTKLWISLLRGDVSRETTTHVQARECGTLTDTRTHSGYSAFSTSPEVVLTSSYHSYCEQDAFVCLLPTHKGLKRSSRTYSLANLHLLWELQPGGRT